MSNHPQKSGSLCSGLLNFPDLTKISQKFYLAIITNTNTLNFSGTATSYNWSNSQPSIGLSSSGSGNIVSFLAELEEYICSLITYTAFKRDDPQAAISAIPLEKLFTKDFNRKDI